VVLSDGLVEVVVLLLGDVRLLSEPDGLDLVDGLPLPDLLSDSLGLGLLGLCGALLWLGLALVLNLVFSLLSRLFSGLLLIGGDLLADLLR